MNQRKSVEPEAVTLPETEEDDDINLFDLNNQVSSNVQESKFR